MLWDVGRCIHVIHDRSVNKFERFNIFRTHCSRDSLEEKGNGIFNNATLINLIKSTSKQKTEKFWNWILTEHQSKGFPLWRVVTPCCHVLWYILFSLDGMECWLSKCEASSSFLCDRGKGFIYELLLKRKRKIPWIPHYNDGRVERGDEAEIVCFVRNDRQ